MKKFDLDAKIQEIINIKYIEVLINRLYNNNFITKQEHDLLIIQYKNSYEEIIKETEALNEKR